MDDSLLPENLRSRIAAAEEIHKRAHERDREQQRLLDAVAAAELNLKAARNSEAQAIARAMAAEAASSRSQSSAGIDPGTVAALEKQLGEARRMESAAAAEAAALREQLEEARRSLTAAAGDGLLASLREEASKARAEHAAVSVRSNVLARELELARARIAQLEAAAVTIQARASGPPPELREARAEADKARHAARSAEGTISKLRRDLSDALSRIKALETTLAATRAAIAVSPSVSGDLAAARREAADLRSQLNTARSEIGRLKQARPPRPPREPREPGDDRPAPAAAAPDASASELAAAAPGDAPADAAAATPPAEGSTETLP
jgi:chromosome segregation ATPase